MFVKNNSAFQILHLSFNFLSKDCFIFIQIEYNSILSHFKGDCKLLCNSAIMDC